MLKIFHGLHKKLSAPLLHTECKVPNVTLSRLFYHSGAHVFFLLVPGIFSGIILSWLSCCNASLESFTSVIFWPGVIWNRVTLNVYFFQLGCRKASKNAFIETPLKVFTKVKYCRSTKSILVEWLPCKNKNY